MFRRSLMLFVLVASALVLMPLATSINASESNNNQEVNAPSSIENIYPRASEDESLDSMTDGTPTLSSTAAEYSSVTNSSEKETSNSELETSVNDEMTKEQEKSEGLQTSRTGEVTASNWSEFREHFNNQDVTKITLTDEVTQGMEGLNSRTTSLEVDGGDFSLDLGSETMKLGKTSQTESKLKLHNFKAITAKSEIIKLTNSNSEKWRFEIGDITVPVGTTSNVLTAERSEVLLFGQLDVTTLKENFTIGSAVFADGTEYTGETTTSDTSLFYYPNNVSSGTGKSREFKVNPNSVVKLKNGVADKSAHTGNAAILNDYSEIFLDENSKLIIDMYGPVINMGGIKGIGSHVKPSSIVIKDGASLIGTSHAFSNFLEPTLNLPSGAIMMEGNATKNILVDSGGTLDIRQNDLSHALILMRGSNNSIKSNPGAKVNLVGSTSSPVPAFPLHPFLSTISNDPLGSNNSIVFDSPAYFNIQNTNPNNSGIKSEGKGFEFRVENTSLGLWNLGNGNDDQPSYSYPKISTLTLTPIYYHEPKDNVKIKLDNQTLFDEEAVFNRLSGSVQQSPEVIWTELTDADLSAKVRVISGYVPGAKPEDNWIPIYASDTPVTFYDESGVELSTVPTDKDGYASHTFTEFPKAGTKIKAVAKIADKTSEETATTVIDVTPPKPAEIDGGTEQISTIKRLTGTGEVGSVVTLEHQGKNVMIPKTVVDADGKWEIDVSSLKLERDHKLQVFLRDNVGSLVGKVPNRPKTNTDEGNINPKKNYSYRDTDFPAATVVKILGELKFISAPSEIDFGKQLVKAENQSLTPVNLNEGLVISDTRGGDGTWQLLLSENNPTGGNSKVLSDVFVYYRSDGSPIDVNDAGAIIESGATNEQDDIELSKDWSNKRGLIMNIPVEKQLLGTYEGNLKWTLQDSPGNP